MKKQAIIEGKLTTGYDQDSMPYYRFERLVDNFQAGLDIDEAIVCALDVKADSHGAVSYTHLTLPTTPYV